MVPIQASYQNGLETTNRIILMLDPDFLSGQLHEILQSSNPAKLILKRELGSKEKL
jgi:hypothetical protein